MSFLAFSSTKDGCQKRTGAHGKYQQLCNGAVAKRRLPTHLFRGTVQNRQPTNVDSLRPQPQRLLRGLRCPPPQPSISRCLYAQADRCGSVPNVGVGLGSRGQPEAAQETENHLERRHSSSCHVAFLPGTGLSAGTSSIILAACSAAVPS